MAALQEAMAAQGQVVQPRMKAQVVAALLLLAQMEQPFRKQVEPEAMARHHQLAVHL